MYSSIKQFLSNLEETFINFYNTLPQMAEYLEQPLIKCLPYISFILGLLSLYSMYDLWHSAHSVNTLITFANDYGKVYGVPKVHLNHHMGPAFWLAMLALLLEAVLFFKAYSGTKARLKSGWDLVYAAFVVNVIYGIILLFSYYGGIGTLADRLLFSLVCLYFLFEIRDSYNYLVPIMRAPASETATPSPTKPVSKKKAPAKKKPVKKNNSKK